MLDPFSDISRIDFGSLKTDIDVIVKEMDRVLEENIDRHAIEEQKEMARKYRNVGIGIMGLSDLFVKLGVRYGDVDSVDVARNLMQFIFREAVYASVRNGKTYGNFPGYSDKVWDSEIIKNAFTEEEIDEFRSQGTLRNCSLISIAPTGSIGTMLNVSTGVEPFFALKYNRRSESLGKTYSVNVKAVEEYKDITGNTELPSYFVTAMDIPWRKRIDIQSALQEFCDTGISSTINLPEDTTVDAIKGLYRYAWEKGLKGVTVYRTGSREGVLTLDEESKPSTTKVIPKRPKELPASCYSVKIKGQQFIVVIGLLDDKPYEVFAFKIVDYINIPYHEGTITKIKKGQFMFKSEYFTIPNLITEMGPEEQAVTLYCSMLMRHGIDLEYIRKTTKKVNGNVTSFSSAICRILSVYIPKKKEGTCPNCGGTLIHQGGCLSCDSCEYSKCE